MTAMDVADQMEAGAPVIRADIATREAKQRQTDADLEATDLQLANTTADLLKTLSALAACQGQQPQPPVPPNPADPGSIDPKGIPTNGKLVFGASTPSLDGTYNYTKGWTEFVAATGGIEPDMTHFYRVGDQTLITPAMIAASPGALMSVCHKVAGGMGKAAYQKTLSGGSDAAIRRAANDMLNYDKMCFYLPDHEPENDNINPVDPAVDKLYCDAQKYVVDHLHQYGVTFVRDGGKVHVGQNFMGFVNHIPRYDALFATGYFDGIWFDPYGHNATETLSNFDSVVQSYNWAKKHNLPIGWAEYGLDMRYASSFSKWANPTTVKALRNAFPLLAWCVYWNQKMNTTDGNYVLSAAPKAAVTAWANSPEYNVVIPVGMRAA